MKFFKRADAILVGMLVLTAGVLWGIYHVQAKGLTAKAEIYSGSQLVETIELREGEEKSFSIADKEQVVFQLYSDGSIAFAHSDCPDQVCVRAGRLHLVGQTAACLPNELIIKLVAVEGAEGDHLDLIL